MSPRENNTMTGLNILAWVKARKKQVRINVLPGDGPGGVCWQVTNATDESTPLPGWAWDEIDATGEGKVLWDAWHDFQKQIAGEGG